MLKLPESNHGSVLYIILRLEAARISGRLRATSVHSSPPPWSDGSREWYLFHIAMQKTEKKKTYYLSSLTIKITQGK